MTAKEKAIRTIERLPADVSLGEIVETLQHLEPEPTPEHSAELERSHPAGGFWDLLEEAAGTVEMPTDWAREHDHYLYGTPKRSSSA